MVTALGVAWILDGLEITIASNVGPDLTLKSTLNMSAGAVADIATWYLIAFLPEGCRETVDLGVVFAEVVETGVAPAGTCRGGRVHPVQVGDDLPRGEQLAVTITRAVNSTLFIVVVLELVRTIVARLEGGGFQLQPSLVIGIISATRDILTVGAELSLVGEQTPLVRTMTELGVNAGVVVALFIALVLVRRFVRLDRA